MAQDKIDLRQSVADTLTKLMQTSGADWTKPWRDIGQPINLVSGKAYRGMNVLLLVTSPHKDRTWAREPICFPNCCATIRKRAQR